MMQTNAGLENKGNKSEKRKKMFDLTKQLRGEIFT